MAEVTRRKFLKTAVLVGAAAAWAKHLPAASTVSWHERRDLFPEGVASGDPDSSSVLLWTRRTPAGLEKPSRLTLEVGEDQGFHRVVATESIEISADADWTCRVLVGGLKPAHLYWYRFTDTNGNGSRVGRTLTAPADHDPRPVRFAFVSCQNANVGAQNAYRRMLYEDERAPEAEKLGFVLHLGDFIYELVWYPEDRAKYYDRRVRELVRYQHGEKIQDFHIPTTADDYRAAYKAVLHDPDLQDARAHFPFVPMWDNHEYSWLGWQGFQRFGGKNFPAQTRKVSANQAFFEYQPARLLKPSGPSLASFGAPKVDDAPITKFDEHGLGQEPNNLAAIGSLRGYRSLRWGRNLDLIITDERSYRTEDPFHHPEAETLGDKDFPEFLQQEVLEVVDGGRAYNGGKPPQTIRGGDADIPNFRKDEPPQSFLGVEQKAWFLEQLRKSKATWKIWGSTTATLEMRVDPQNLPEGLVKPWPGKGYGIMTTGDVANAFWEKGEIYDFVRSHGLTGFVTVAGDRHSFWAGLSAKSLPPETFEPVGLAFVTGSVSAPGLWEAYQSRSAKNDPLHALFVGQGPKDQAMQPTVNMLLRHGVWSCLEYVKSGDMVKAREQSNPEMAPHLAFVDMGGHGYAVVRLSGSEMEAEFVCIEPPLERQERPDGGPLNYRARFQAPLWRKGEAPKLQTKIIEGDPRFSV
jgi:alkaline phosphatase D